MRWKTWRTPPSYTRYSAHVPGKVLHARHLDPRHVARHAEATDAIAMRVAGEVPDDARPCSDKLDQPFGVVGADAEVVSRPIAATPDSTRGGGRTPGSTGLLSDARSSSQANVSVVDLTGRGGRDRRVDDRQRHARQLDRTRCIVGERVAVVRVVVAADVDRADRRTRPRSTSRKSLYSSNVPFEVRSPFTTSVAKSRLRHLVDRGRGSS